MTTLLKLRGLERAGQGATGGSVLSDRGPRIKWGLGKADDKGTAATLTIGAGNAAVVYTAAWKGAVGNNVKVAHVVTGTNTRSIVTTIEAATGKPIITVTAATTAGTANGTETATNIAAAVNADPIASQYVTAVAGGTGGSVVTAAAAAALATGADSSTTDFQRNINFPLNSKQTVVVDIDDGGTARFLYRARGRFVSLGQP